MELLLRRIEESCAREMVTWQYDPPYDIYNCDPEEVDEITAYLIDPQYNFYCIVSEENDLVGFCSFGEDGQVPGGNYSAEALDIGMGIRPDLTGKGLGIQFIETVLDFAKKTFSVSLFRVTIAAFNHRAQKVWQKAGFYPVQFFQKERSASDFVILTRHV